MSLWRDSVLFTLPADKKRQLMDKLTNPPTYPKFGSEEVESV